MGRWIITLLSVLSFSAVAEARSYKSSRASSHNRPVRQAAYSPERESGDAGSATLGGMSVNGSRKESNLGVKGAAGMVTGFPGLDGAPTILSADLIWYLSRNLYVPFGFSTWDGDMKIDSEGKTYKFGIGITTVDTGLGYDLRLSKRIGLGLGSRIGWAKIEADYEGETIYEKEGWNLTPFLGLGFSPTPRATIGFESRLPIIVVKDTSDDSDDDDDEEEDDDGGDSKIPLYHMLTLAIRLP